MLKRPNEETSSYNHPFSDSLIRLSVSCSSLHVHDEVADIECHLGSRGRGAIIIVKESVYQLTGHADDHMVKVGVEVFALRDVDAIRSLVMIASEDVIDVVNASRSKTDLREISRPYSSIRVLSFIYGIIGRIYPIMDNPIPILPFLVVVLFEVMMGRVNAEHSHHVGQFDLFISLVQKGIIFLVDHTMTVSTVTSEHLEPSSDRSTVITT